MRFVIYGAGAIGGALGGLLAQAGQEVALIARGAHLAALQQDGLRLMTPDGTRVLHLVAAAGARALGIRPDDVVCLCVKGQDSEAALRELAGVAPRAPLFCFQNGVRNEEIAARFVTQVYGVMVSVRGVHLRPGEVYAPQDPPGYLYLGCYPQGKDALAEDVAARLRQAGFLVTVTDDVMPYKWGKLMDNLSNAIIAATRGANDPHEPTGDIAAAVRAEAGRLLQQAGQRWISTEEQRRHWPEITGIPRRKLQIDAHGSTWQSLRRGQGSVEVDFLNGEIVRLARRLGAQAPLNEGLDKVLLEMAASGQPPGSYSAAQLRQRLGLPEPPPAPTKDVT